MSAILPGLGQAYNKKYWKIPIIYAGIGGFGYMFLNNNKQRILQIADKHAGDVQKMQHDIDVFLQPYIENTPEFIANRIKAAIGGAISKRNIQNNPELSQTYDKLKNVSKIVK